MAAQKYYIKITMESGNRSNDEPYQQTVFMQNYDTPEQQIAEQQEVFSEVAMLVAGKMVQYGKEHLGTAAATPVKKAKK